MGRALNLTQWLHDALRQTPHPDISTRHHRLFGLLCCQVRPEVEETGKTPSAQYKLHIDELNGKKPSLGAQLENMLYYISRLYTLYALKFGLLK